MFTKSDLIIPLHKGCHDSCGSCSRPVSPAHCLTCNGSLSLHGAPPSVCTDDICSGSTFLDSLGNCTGRYIPYMAKH